MNREIKFRYITASGMKVFTLEEISNNDFEDNYPIDCFAGQYTGLKDKNGIEIYEGDIIEIPNEYTFAGKLVVKFGEYSGISCAYISGYPGIYSKGVIIGNIYEHEELLGK